MRGRAIGNLFLVGAERSGTTLLRLMLGHHPEIAWQNEFEFAVDQMSEEGECPALDEYKSWLSTHRIFAATRFVIDGRLSYPELVRSFLEQRRAGEGKPIVGATVHRHFDRLLRIWQEGRRAQGDLPPSAHLYTAYCLLGKVPAALGILTYWLRRVRRRGTSLIEYKSPAQTT